MFRRETGNTITEYGFIAALVMFMMIGLLFLLGGNLKNAMNNLKGDLTQNIASASSAKSGLGTGSSKYDPLAQFSQTALPKYEPPTGKIKFGGETIYLPSPPKVSTNTTGGNGSDMTSAYIMQLEKLVDELNDEDVDQALANLISELAKAGHELADSEETLEEYCALGTACTSYSTTNQTKQAQKQYDQMLSMFTDIGDGNKNFQQKLDALQAYLDANPGEIPQEIRQFVEAQSDQITAIAGIYKPGFMAKTDTTIATGTGTTTGTGTGTGTSTGTSATGTGSTMVAGVNGSVSPSTGLTIDGTNSGGTTGGSTTGGTTGSTTTDGSNLSGGVASTGGWSVGTNAAQAGLLTGGQTGSQVTDQNSSNIGSCSGDPNCVNTSNQGGTTNVTTTGGG